MSRIVFAFLILSVNSIIGCASSSTSGSGNSGGSSDKKGANAVSGDKLVGKWELVKGSEGLPPGTTVEFVKDGKLVINLSANGKSLKMEGGYKRDGDQLTLTMKGPDGKEKPEKETIKTLTDDKLITTDNMGKDTEFKKSK